MPPFFRALPIVALATLCIVIGDTAGKALTGAGIAPFFVAWTRFALAAAVILPLIGLTREERRVLLRPAIVLRGLLIAGGIASILTALRTEPIANVFGAFFIGPILSWVGGAIFLRERVSAARFVLLLMGFVGVLVVVRPGGQMGPGMGFALLAGTFYGAFLVVTRALAPHHRPRFLLASQLLVGAVALAPLGIASTPGAVDGQVMGLVIVSALASAAGNYLLVMVSRSTPASVVAPLIYVQIVWAVALGALVFGDWPDYGRLAGMGLILVSGLAGLWLAQRGTAGHDHATK